MHKGSMTRGQREELAKLMVEEAGTCSCSTTAAQAFLSHGGRIRQFRKDLVKFLEDHISRYYDPNFSSRLSLPEIRLRLMELLPGIRIPRADYLITKLPKDCAGAFIFPKLSFLGRRYNVPDPYGDGFNTVVLQLAEEAGLNYLDLPSPEDDSSLTLHPAIKAWLVKKERTEPGHTWTAPVNAGMLGAGYDLPDVEANLKNGWLHLSSAHGLIFILICKDALPNQNYTCHGDTCRVRNRLTSQEAITVPEISASTPFHYAYGMEGISRYYNPGHRPYYRPLQAYVGPQAWREAAD
jgi:hypothetical protein